MSICWWGFSSTSRFHDVIPNDVKGETLHPKEGGWFPASIRPRCILMSEVSPSLLRLLESTCPSLQQHFATCVDPSHRKIIPRRGYHPGLYHRVSWHRLHENRISDNVTHADVTVNNLAFGAAQLRHWPGKV